MTVFRNTRCIARRKNYGKDEVKPGDILAVNGVHVIAYLGEGRCIDSDPLQGGVAEASREELSGKTNDTWFNGPVRVERWKQ